MRPPVSERAVLTARGVSKSYLCRMQSGCQEFRILENVNLDLYLGKTLALIGDSGSGKSTLARCLAGFEKPDCGDIWVEGERINSACGKQSRELHGQVQLLWQDSSGALSPFLDAQEIVDEPMRICGRLSPAERRTNVEDLFHKVGLPQDCKMRRAKQLSGGQRQRLAIARALAARPRILILDEPFTALDLSIRNQILNLLLDLQEATRLTYLYISHDLDLVRFFADEVAELHAGSIVARNRDTGCSVQGSAAETDAPAELVTLVSGSHQARSAE